MHKQGGCACELGKTRLLDISSITPVAEFFFVCAAWLHYFRFPGCWSMVCTLIEHVVFACVWSYSPDLGLDRFLPVLIHIH